MNKQNIALILLAFLLLTISYSSASFAKKIVQGEYHFNADVPLPEWVVDVPVALENFRSRPKRADAIRYILHDRQRSVVGHKQRSFIRLAMQPWSQDGLEDASQVTFSFSPVYQHLDIHWIRVYRNGNLVSEYEPAKVKLLQQEKDIDIRQYNGQVTALSVLEDVRIGDIIDYAYTIDGHNPVLGENYSARHIMAWGTPVDHLQLRLNIEKKRRLKIKYKDIKLKPRESVKDGVRTYTWTRKNVPAVMNDGQTPVGYDAYPRIYISEFDSWRDVKRWAEELYTYNDDLSPEVHALIDQWKLLGDKEEQARKALAFVQKEIRYFGVEMGQNSHRPSEPPEVVRRRYGDCKDKALLLVAMLREMGMKAWPALVSVDHNKGIRHWLPTPKAFDHVIVVMEYKGKTIWLDGTRGYQKGRLQNIGLPDFGLALVIGKGKGLTEIAYSDHNRPFIDVEERFIISRYNGPIEMEVVSRYHAERADKQRKNFQNNSREEVQQDYLNYYARKYPDIQVNKPLKVIDHEDENIFEIRESYFVENYLEHDEDKLYVTLRGSTLNSWLSFPDKVKRSMPLGMYYPIKIRHVSSVTYPEDIEFDLRSDEERIVAPGFVYNRVSSYKPNTLSVMYELETTDDHVAAKDISPYLKKIKDARGDLSYSVWVREPQWMSSQRLARETDPMVDELVERLSRKK